MALRNQPYIPLYVQDFLTDEKLNMCNWATQGVYIKIMCVLHKQQSYGSILFKQTAKQDSSNGFDFVHHFASILVRNIPCQMEDMINALNELLEHKVLYIDEEGLHQKRMVKDGKISEARSKAGKKGGGNPLLFKQKSKQTSKQRDKQITEYEYEYENDNINSNKEGASIDSEKQMPKKNSNDKLNHYLDLVPDEWRESVESWLLYKRSRGEMYKSERSFKTFFNAVKKESSGNVSVFLQSIEQSVKNNWAGVFPEKNLPKSHAMIDHNSKKTYEEF